MNASFVQASAIDRAVRKFGAAFWVCLSILGVALPSAAPGALDQNVSATATLSDPIAEVGQTVEYRIQVTGGTRGGQAPQTPEVAGLTFTEVGRNQSTQISGGSGGIRVVEIVSYVYNVEAQRPGKYVIPGQEIQTGAGTAKVQPIAFNVSGAGAGGGRADPGLSKFVELVIPKKSAYVGESVPIEVKAYFGSAMRFEIDPNPVLGGEGFTVQKFTPPQVDVQLVEDAQFRVVTFRSVIAGVKTGALSIGPVSMSPILHMPRNNPRRRGNYNDPFDDPFFRDPFGAFDGTVTKQETLKSDPQAVEIKPLPPGAPPDFSGAIGQFKLEAAAEPRRVRAGDPITVRLQLSGSGNFDRVNAPALLDERNLRAYPATAKFKPDEDLGLAGVKTFEQVVVAQNSRASLPGYHFSYFDPVAVRYVSLETPPLPVKVEGNATAPSPAAGDAAQADSSPAPSATPKPKTAPQDILYLRTDAGRTVGAEAFQPLYRQRGFWLMQLAPSAMLLGLAGWLWQRRRARDTVARRAAEVQRQQAQLVKALQSERTGRRDFYSAATRLAQLRAAQAVGRNDALLSVSEVCAAKRLDPQTAASVEDIFHRHDELAYSGAFAAQEPVPPTERRDVLAALETLERK